MNYKRTAEPTLRAEQNTAPDVENRPNTAGRKLRKHRAEIIAIVAVLIAYGATTAISGPPIPFLDLVQIIVRILL
jgi:hypothetical protein